MMEFLDTLGRYSWAISLLSPLLLGWIVWSFKTGFWSRAEGEAAIKDLTAEVKKQLAVAADERHKAAARLTRIEERQNAAPSHADLTRIHERLDRIADVASRLEGALQPLNRLTDLLTQAQLDRERTVR